MTERDRRNPGRSPRPGPRGSDSRSSEDRIRRGPRRDGFSNDRRENDPTVPFKDRKSVV